MARIGYNPEREAIGSDSLTPKPHPSECVRALEYDMEREELVIHFHKRGSYSYFNFPRWAFAEFNAAGSRGTYFNLYIRDAGYDFERIG